MNTRIEELDFIHVILQQLMKYPDHNATMIQQIIDIVDYRLDRECFTEKSRAISGENRCA